MFRLALCYAAHHYRLCRRAGDHRGAAVAAGNLAIGYERLGDPTRAAAGYRRAWREAGRSGDVLTRLNAAGCLGALYCRQRRFPAAGRWFRRQRRMAVRAGDRQTEGAACGNLGVVLLEQGDPAAAVDWFRHHARLAEGAPRMVGTATVNIGLCLDRLGDRTEAAVVLARAADLLDAAGDPIAATVRRQLAVWAG